MKRITQTIALAGCAALALAAFASPANAARSPKSTAGLSAHIQPGAQPAVPSTNYGAGYFSYPGGGPGIASASVTFTMPSISCASASDAEWLLPGIWVYDSGGNLSQQVDVNFNCNSGSILMTTVVCISGTCALDPVAPGDTLVASIAYTATNTVGTVRNLTSNVVSQVSGGAVTGDYTVFMGDEGPSLFGVSAVPTFSMVKFSKAQVNGQYLSDWSPGRWNLKTTSNVQITAGVLNAQGDGFTTKFKNNY